MRFKILDCKDLLRTYPFTVQELTLAETADGAAASHNYYRLKAPDWVNVLPITRDGKAVLIRQFRVGSMSEVIETPGGVIEDGERDATMAAVRELEEETGYTSQRILPLGIINPNPAIMTNRTHFFMALDCVINPQRKHFPDASEQIEAFEVDVGELQDMVRQGRLNHALSALCIFLAGKYLKGLDAKP